MNRAPAPTMAGFARRLGIGKEEGSGGATKPKTDHWLPDSEAANCFQCREKFSFKLRKHHCRNCGLIYCANCCSSRLALPHLGYDKPERVCAECARKVASGQFDSAEPQNKEVDEAAAKAAEAAEKARAAAKLAEEARQKEKEAAALLADAQQAQADADRLNQTQEQKKAEEEAKKAEEEAKKAAAAAAEAERKAKEEAEAKAKAAAEAEAKRKQEEEAAAAAKAKAEADAAAAAAAAAAEAEKKAAEEAAAKHAAEEAAKTVDPKNLCEQCKEGKVAAEVNLTNADGSVDKRRLCRPCTLKLQEEHGGDPSDVAALSSGGDEVKIVNVAAQKVDAGVQNETTTRLLAKFKEKKEKRRKLRAEREAKAKAKADEERKAAAKEKEAAAAKAKAEAGTTAAPVRRERGQSAAPTMIDVAQDLMAVSEALGSVDGVDRKRLTAVYDDLDNELKAMREEAERESARTRKGTAPAALQVDEDVDDPEYVKAMIEQLPLPPELNKLIDDVTSALLKAGHKAPSRNEALNIVGTFDPSVVGSAPPPPPPERRKSSPLPLGWKCALSADGIPYYFYITEKGDHEGVQWDIPTTVAPGYEAKVKPKAPPPAPPPPPPAMSPPPVRAKPSDKRSRPRRKATATVSESDQSYLLETIRRNMSGLKSVPKEAKEARKSEKTLGDIIAGAIVDRRTSFKPETGAADDDEWSNESE